MAVSAGNLNELIQNAWESALESSKGIQLDGGSPKRSKEWWLHSQRVKKWVESLGKGFEEEYNDLENAGVFWSPSPREMLFDLAVCKISTVESVTLEKLLCFVAGCHWQIESELNNKNSRAIVTDLSKLVMGLSENKLFVASHKSTGKEWESSVLTMCSEIAKCCDGKLFFCFIAHPEEWGKIPHFRLRYTNGSMVTGSDYAPVPIHR